LRGPMLTFFLLGIFIIFLYMSLAFVAFMNDLTGLPVYLLLYLSPVYLIGVYFFWTEAKKSYQEKMFKKVVALFFILFLAFALPISVILAAVPNWNITVTTDKIMYRLGENVTITATLTNNAFFAKALDSFFSPSSSIEISVTNGSIPHQHKFFYELVKLANIGDSVGPRQSIQKTLTWQAVNGAGQYYVHADSIGNNRLSDQVNITITL
jgi:hypothetical protein